MHNIQQLFTHSNILFSNTSINLLAYLLHSGCCFRIALAVLLIILFEHFEFAAKIFLDSSPLTFAISLVDFPKYFFQVLEDLLLLITIMTIAVPMLSPYDYAKQDLKVRKQWPSADHWFGTDDLGRDLFTRVWQGGRVSIAIGVLGALIVAAVGCVYGGIAAYFGGWVDMLMMRIVEILSSVPNLLVIIMMSIILDSSSIPTRFRCLIRESRSEKRSKAPSSAFLRKMAQR